MTQINENKQHSAPTLNKPGPRQKDVNELETLHINNYTQVYDHIDETVTFTRTTNYFSTDS